MSKCTITTSNDLTFCKLKRAADVTCRPVEEVLAVTLDAALPEPSGLPAEQEQLLAAYHRSVLRRAQALAVLAQPGASHPN